MKIIYMHHANRDISRGLNQENAITKEGMKEAQAIGEILGNYKVPVSCIYQGDFLRYTLTTEQINKLIQVPIIIDDRLNEYSWNGKETSIEYEKRIHSAISDIIAKNDNKNTVICITSGVALHWFMTFFYKGVPIEGFVRVSADTCSPVTFHYDKDKKDPYISKWK